MSVIKEITGFFKVIFEIKPLLQSCLQEAGTELVPYTASQWGKKLLS